ncbi:hypothetical protein [Providencia stuartii]|uniref:hypothetical protein n=1 Tax=Providencia stuartii TaxID=588 RepID=UPI001123C859|nr:hypothetical protein [Providencia stuartii]
MINRERSHRQNSALSARRNLGLESVVKAAPGFSCQGKVGEFIDFYLRCEVFAAKLQSFYQKDKNLNNQSALNIVTLRNALEHFNLYFKYESLDLIYKGGTGNRGSKSARQLRNGYLHGLSEADKNEIEQRSSEYVELMKLFLQLRLTS